MKRTRGESMRSADWEAQDYLGTQLRSHLRNVPVLFYSQVRHI
jgi:hypothetical protein